MDTVPIYFGQLTPFFNPLQSEALRFINALLRNEIAAPDFGLEPMGLAAWRVSFPPRQIGSLAPLDPGETDDLVEAVTRLLATEDVLLPPTLDLRDWADLVPAWDRNLLVAPGGESGNHRVVFNPTGAGKLGRFLRAVGTKLAGLGRLAPGNAVDQWLATIQNPLFQSLIDLGIVTPDATGVAYGLSIDRFQLETIGDMVFVCRVCAYVSNRSVLNTCLRCGQDTEHHSVGDVANYYRRVVEYAGPGTPFPDPFPLKVFEHSAQIEKAEARRFELRFQDVFLQNENPDDARIDALSVTTTMEMGIDIGALLSVGLRNVPPTVANYQQRAGRAGRRGSSVATVVTYAQNRGHDQYYFARPPRIVTDPPRIPRMHLANSVIAQRHVRALVLERFFRQWGPTVAGSAVGGLLSAWGTVGRFNQNNGTQDLTAWVNANRIPLIERCGLIVDTSLRPGFEGWVTAVPGDVQRILAVRPREADVLSCLLDVGLLPRHAFPIDVVSLWTGRMPLGSEYRERGVQRDLAIALSEFAPGAEVVRNKRVFRVAGLYDPFSFNPSFQPDGRFIECRDCQALQFLGMAAATPVQCSECTSHRLVSMPMLRPPGFCSDWAGPEAGGRRYLGGGRERAGSSVPARLAIGDYSFTSPHSTRPSFAPQLDVLVRTGDLYVVNRGADQTSPGFRICPQCGRSLAPNEAQHTYPADVPPDAGPNRGPRAGQVCPNRNPTTNNVLLGHHFPSDIIQLGVELPSELDADIRVASGRAVWLSFGTLVVNASARFLQINPEELQVGIRPVRRPLDRVHAEVYIYDTLPGGAGYARDIEASLEPILRQAVSESRTCSNPECAGSCYGCLLGYQNQAYHALLDRELGGAVLQYLLGGVLPSLSVQEADRVSAFLRPYLPADSTVLGPTTVAGQYFPLMWRDSRNQTLALLPRHALEAQPDANALQRYLVNGVRCCSYATFDLTRRPFWVANHIASGS